MMSKLVLKNLKLNNNYELCMAYILKIIIIVLSFVFPWFVK